MRDLHNEAWRRMETRAPRAAEFMMAADEALNRAGGNWDEMLGNLADLQQA